jgi:hypothetical protein
MTYLNGDIHQNASTIGYHEGLLKMDAPREGSLPFAEFRRRLLGTIAKRKEAERAEKVAKLGFGVRVMTPDGEGIFHESSAGVGNWVIFPKGQRNFTLDEITIL